MKKYSQVFLKNENVCAKIAIYIKSFYNGDALIEIGPGKGNLTKYILDITNNLYLIEIDEKMINILNSTFKQKLKIFHQDFMTINLDKTFKNHLKCFFVGNLPYHISTAIVEKLMYFDKFSGAIFMFQKEVANKITAKYGESSYGYFSALCFAKFKTTKLFNVSKNNFFPVPKIDSSVVLFEPESKISKYEFEKYKKIISASFFCKRKNILNSFFLATNKDKDKIKVILEKSGINQTERAENIAPEKFVNLTKYYDEIWL